MDETIPINNECVICYDSITNNEYIEPCKHPVHHQCFLMTKTNICPICRQNVTCPLFKCNIYEHDKFLQLYYNSLIFFTVSIYVFLLFLFFSPRHHQ
jgi:hypothetical protein